MYIAYRGSPCAFSSIKPPTSVGIVGIDAELKPVARRDHIAWTEDAVKSVLKQLFIESKRMLKAHKGLDMLQRDGGYQDATGSYCRLKF
jgi:hypothetical protein